MKLLLVTLALFFPSAAPAATLTQECGGSSWSGYHWCVHRDPSSSSKRTVVYLHGNGGSERSWPADDNTRLQELLNKSPEGAPAIITLSLGGAWFLNEEGGTFSRSNLETLLEKALPEAEAKLGFSPSPRVLVGKSMGGFNATQLFAKAPAGTFSAAAILCPAQPPLTPFATRAEMETFIQARRTYIRPDLVEKWTERFRQAYSTPALWKKHDPLELAAGMAASKTPLFLQADDQDVFGFYPNAEKFHQALKAKGANVQWHVTVGGQHCQLNEPMIGELAKFLLQ